jgi:hypothetical protein
VEEHRHEDRDERRGDAVLAAPQPLRDEAVCRQETVELGGRERQLEEKAPRVPGDQKPVDPRRGPGDNGVAERDQADASADCWKRVRDGVASAAGSMARRRGEGDAGSIV